MLTSLYHEIRHSEQYNKLINSSEEYNVLINNSLTYMEKNYKFYLNNHSLFLSEHDADLNAMAAILSDIEESNLNVCLNSIYVYNIYIAYFILRSRGYIIEDNKLIRESIFKSPLHMLFLFSKLLYKKNKINKENLNEVCISIKNIRINNITEYDRIISGDNLSEETINELFLIANGKIKTENIFKHFENKELDKNNNNYVKKLLLSKE